MFSYTMNLMNTKSLLWCCFSYVISQILSGDARESIVENIHTKLQEVGEQVRNGEIPEELYHITKVRFVFIDTLIL